MEPKYKIGDEVWVMQNGMPTRRRICVVATTPHENMYALTEGSLSKFPHREFWPRPFRLSLMMRLFRHDGFLQPMKLYVESEFFPSKEALIQSL